MNCARMEGRLIAYVDGRASQAEREEVEAHLAACEDCRTRSEEFGRLWGVLGDLPAFAPSPVFDARVRARLAAEPRPRLWSWLMPQPRLAFAVTALAVLASWVSVQPPAPVEVQTAAARTEEDFRVVKDLTVLENYDVLANFEALSVLPATQLPGEPEQERE